MTVARQAQIWCALLAAFALALYVLGDVLLPFILGMGIAYVLDPLADRLERLGLSRTLATVIIVAAFLLLVGGALALLAPVLQSQIVGLVTRLGDLVETALPALEDLIDRMIRSQPAPANQSAPDAQKAATDMAATALKWMGSVLGGLWAGGMILFNLISLLLVTPIVAFYLLRDWDRVVAHVDGLLPRAHAPVIREQMRQIDERMSGFLRGQALVCLLLGIFYAVGLTLVGLDFGLVVGLGTGIMSFIPYVGMLAGTVVGLALAFAQNEGWTLIGLVLGVFLVGQAIEGNFVTPKLVGERVGLHPVWIIFALLAGGALFGFAGVALSVPAAAAIGVLSRFALERYRESALYAGGRGAVEDERPPRHELHP